MQRRVAVPERVAEQRRRAARSTRDEDEQQPVQRALERRARMAERPRLAGEPRGVAVLADGRDGVGADALDGERARSGPRRRRARSTGRDSPVRIDSSSAQRRRRARASPSATTWSPGCEPRRGRRRRPRRRATPRAAPSRTTVARGATSAESRSSARFARTSCTIPIPAFATRMPRKSASCHSPNASVSDAGDGEDQVEDREDVGADDARVRAARPCGGARAALGSRRSPRPRRGRARRVGSTSCATFT